MVKLRQGLWAAGIFLLALAVRLFYLWQIRETPLTEILLIDSETYDRLAKLILSGEYRGEQTYAVNFLYPWFLAAIYAVGKTGTILIVQAVLDSLSCVIVYWLGCRLFSRPVGVLAGVVMALYGPLVFYTGALLTPTLITFLGLVAVSLLVKYNDTPRWPLVFAAGIVIGLATLTRGNNILLLVAGAIYLAVSLGSWRRTVRPAAVMTLGALLIVSVVTVRNYTVEGRMVPVSANYAALYVGHNPEATGLYAMPSFTEGAAFEDEVMGTREAVSEMLGRDVTLAESSQYLFNEGVRYAVSHPLEEVKLTARKFYFFWNRTESPTNLNYYFARDYSSLLGLLPLTFGLIAPLGLFGMWLSRREWRKHLLLYLYVLAVLATCLLFFLSAEYRIPVVPIVILFAAHAVIVLAGEMRGLVRPSKPAAAPAKRGAKKRSKAPPTISLWQRSLVQAVVSLPVLFVFSNVRTTLLAAQSLKRVDYLNFGTLYKNRGELDKAETLLRHSLAIDPRYGPAYATLSEVYRLRGDEMGAARFAQEGRRFQLSGQYERTPDPVAAVADSVLQLVEIYRAGDYPTALAGFERLRDHPEMARTPGLHLSLLNNIGLCHYKMGNLAAAESTYREILAVDSTYVRAHTNLGLVLEAMGRPSDAAAHYETALRIDPDNASARQKLARLLGTAE
jgi:4-amino-4-deoxy-L-arabinose transferase-like glycosyltransferase/Flp pilus assembly protein TadD